MGEPTDIERWLDSEFARLAEEAGARSFAAPGTIPADVLERCNYFLSFPGVAITAADGNGYFPPAACYHVYAQLQGTRLDAPYLGTLAATCGRNETGGADVAGRLAHFRMREVVFVGPAVSVSRTRDEWMDRVTRFAGSLGLSGALAPATDMFFGNGGRGRRLMQQLKVLKYELSMNAGAGGVLAVCSFNLHGTFFTSRFDIRMADGSPAASGCAAFGIERWALAYLAHHGCLR